MAVLLGWRKRVPKRRRAAALHDAGAFSVSARGRAASWSVPALRRCGPQRVLPRGGYRFLPIASLFANFSGLARINGNRKRTMAVLLGWRKRFPKRWRATALHDAGAFSVSARGRAASWSVPALRRCGPGGGLPTSALLDSSDRVSICDLPRLAQINGNRERTMIVLLGWRKRFPKRWRATALHDAGAFSVSARGRGSSWSAPALRRCGPRGRLPTSALLDSSDRVSICEFLPARANKRQPGTNHDRSRWPAQT